MTQFPTSFRIDLGFVKLKNQVLWVPYIWLRRRQGPNRLAEYFLKNKGWWPHGNWGCPIEWAG